MKSQHIIKTDALFADISSLIAEGKAQVALAVNSALTILNWKIGNRIKEDILKSKRAGYGKEIISSLSKQLTETYGRGWSKPQLWNCLYTVEIFPDFQIVATLSRELSWSHIKEIIYVKDELKRDFYLQMCRMERWSIRQLREKIDSMLYERTAISKKPDKLIKHELKNLNEKDELSPDLVFRDPYILDFLGLKDTYSEKNLENAILQELEKFILELGKGFTFIERQKRITIDNEDFYIDLLFFHRKLKRMIAIDFKLGKFKAAYKGQMELYLRYLEKYEMQLGEKSPLGLILCAERSKEQIELLQLDKAGIKIAEYLTELPDKKLLQQKLHTAIEVSKKRLEMNLTEQKTKK
jgi:predicted nuclease of restriction endonuclease-like (RecB) superfamily